MDAIYIPHLLRASEQTETLEIHDYLSGLETLMPVQGVVRVTHQGNYLEVAAQAETIVTLMCDRCLKQYNHRLSIDTSELIWLEEAAEDADNLPLEREITLEELVETLPPQGHFHPDEWLYEQLCLEIPQRKLCDLKCSGISLNDSLPASPPANGDRRWASLEALKRQLS
ncbi:MAG: YceD family protein [Oculatellaceae cyanobacterium bins.114]|nr:YceD family protein [Oculatellaceae cyanobacterium bins.114]